jgi:hypothetical protein
MTDNKQQLAVQPSAQTTSVNFFDPNQFAVVQRMSNLFASSALVPDTYQVAKVGKEQAVANCVIALDIATRIGASPLMVMQNLVIIYGRPSWSSKFLISTVNTCGRFEPLKFRFTEKGKMGKFNYIEYEKKWVNNPNGKGYYKTEAITKEFDGTKIMDIECVAYTTTKGGKDVLESSPISLRMAVDEGWYTKNGSKWRTMPKQMLMYRAASFWTSAYAPELSMGMRTVEETQDIVYVEAEDVTGQVEAEKAANANRETISFDDTTADDVAAGDAPANVDTETGEIKQQKEPDAPAGPAY